MERGTLGVDCADPQPAIGQRGPVARQAHRRGRGGQAVRSRNRDEGSARYGEGKTDRRDACTTVGGHVVDRDKLTNVPGFVFPTIALLSGADKDPPAGFGRNATGAGGQSSQSRPRRGSVLLIPTKCCCPVSGPHWPSRGRLRTSAATIQASCGSSVRRAPSNSRRPPKTISIKAAIANGLASLWNICSVPAITAELSDAGGPERWICQVARPARIRSSDFVSG